MQTKCFFVTIVCLQFFAFNLVMGQSLQAGFRGELENSHDLRLPEWGPYTDKYPGISHIPDMTTGVRFDLTVLPGIEHRRVIVPRVNSLDAPFHPWEAVSDYSYYSYRYEIDGKDRMYADVAFVKIDDASRLVRARLVNNTDIRQPLTLSYLMNINLPDDKRVATQVPGNGVWVSGVPYGKLVLPKAKPNPRDNLGRDGSFRGESTCDGSASLRVLGGGFGQNEGDEVTYSFDSPALTDGLIAMRYRIWDGEKLTLALSGFVNAQVELTATKDFAICSVPLAANTKKGRYSLIIRSMGGAKLLLDGFALIEKCDLDQLAFTARDWDVKPEILAGPNAKSVIQKYNSSDIYYGLAWRGDDYFVKTIENSSLDGSYRNGIYLNSDNRYWAGKKVPEDKKGHYTDVGLAPIVVEPKSEQVVDVLVCRGTKPEVISSIESFNQADSDCGAIVRQYHGKVDSLTVNPVGSSYTLSQKCMAATILTNVFYPVYVQGQYIRHYQPGKMWLSLYTWDAGFIGLGLAEFDLDRSADFLNTYTTAPGAESAFIHHGTPIPVQIYQFYEIWNKTQSRELLEYFYPRLKQYHDFLVGRYDSSTTRKLKSNLIQTWDYFYNSGGWDDYPPQIYVHQNKLSARIAPAANTAHAIRTAKMLKMAALKLGRESDVAEYDRDIRELSKGLEDYAWDKKSGYFGYVMHDEGGEATGILRYEDQVNFNMGLDGVYPYITNQCGEEKDRAMLGHLTSLKELWSPIGLSAVDQSAPYYRHDGYWNGSVWFPHQWFFWKAMFDHGQGEMAYKIAATAVDLWKGEVTDTWNCYENFSIKTRRGGGWQHFGGLSTPVLIWYNALFKPGTVSVGFDTWIDKRRVLDDGIELSMSFYDSKSKHLIWVCLPEGGQYQFTANGQPITVEALHPGLYQVCVTGLKSCELNAKGEEKLSKRE